MTRRVKVRPFKKREPFIPTSGASKGASKGASESRYEAVPFDSLLGPTPIEVPPPQAPLSKEELRKKKIELT